MINFQVIGKIKKAKEIFMSNHPKVQPFLDKVNEKGYEPGQEIAIAVRYPDGTEYKAGIRVTESDLQLLNSVRELTRGM